MKALPLALAASLGLASTAVADSEHRVADQLTERGRFLVGGTVSGFYVRGGGDDASDSWRTTIAPSLAFFVRDHFGVGGSLSVAGGGDGSSHSLNYSVGPDLYYDLVVGERVSLLFTLGFQVGRATFRGRDADASAGIFGMTLAMPVMFHASESVAFGIGPEYAGYMTFGDTDVFDSSEARLGVQSRIAATF